MNIDTGRPDHIMDVMARDHEGQWFGFDNKEQTYANLVMLTTHDGKTYDKPTESYLTTELAKMQANFDDASYSRERLEKPDGYPAIGDQLDMQYHDAVDGTTTWKDHVAAVKAAHPKG